MGEPWDPSVREVVLGVEVRDTKDIDSTGEGESKV